MREAGGICSLIPLPSSLIPMFLAALLVSCTSQPPPPEKHEVVTWHTLGSWSGQGNVQTESFNSDGGLRVQWETKNETKPGAGRFKLSINSAISGRSIGIAVDH